MTLDEFIILQKVNLEKFRAYHNCGVKEFNWFIDQSFAGWENHYQKWSEICKWIKECQKEIE